jgi:Tfp pilus assembly protein PilZ
MGQQFDKRHHKRINQKTAVAIESLQTGINKSARMVNYSNDGLYFETDKLFQPGTEIFIGIENSPYCRPVAPECYLAKIKWGKRLKNNPLAYGYGVKYVDIPREKMQSQTDLEETKDLRKHPRKFYTKLATFRFENKSYDGFITDISRNGCFIENRGFFEAGQILNLFIPGTKFDEDNMLKVEIVRLSPSGVGVKFKSILKNKTKG